MELVSWKTQSDKTLDSTRSAKATYHSKVWERYRNSTNKYKGQVIVLSSTNKFKHAFKLSWFLIRHYKWL